MDRPVSDLVPTGSSVGESFSLSKLRGAPGACRRVGWSTHENELISAETMHVMCDVRWTLAEWAHQNRPPDWGPKLAFEDVG